MYQAQRRQKALSELILSLTKVKFLSVFVPFGPITYPRLMPQVFDRILCCRQLRYSGMMETAKIRRAGYPIRYNFIEFVDRFRHLAHGIPPSHKVDVREAAERICLNTLAKHNMEYQVGHTKVFLKDGQDVFLEQERSRVLAQYILILQRNVRKWICQRR